MWASQFMFLVVFLNYFNTTMPNIINPNGIHKGYFFNSDSVIGYERFPPPSDLVHPIDTIPLVGIAYDSSIYFKLLDLNEDLLSLLRVIPVEMCGQEYYKINKIGSLYKKQGYATYLYNLALRYCEFPLISDINLTRPGSYNIWRSLTMQRDAPYLVSILDTKNCNVDVYDINKNEIEYWGFDQDMLQEFKDDVENIDYLFNDGEIDDSTRDFFISNLNEIVDRKNIRLILSI
jgi:hypothetical protein